MFDKLVEFLLAPAFICVFIGAFLAAIAVEIFIIAAIWRGAMALLGM